MVALGAQNVTSEDDVQGAPRPKEGIYHVLVTAVDESFSKVDDKIIIDFEVLDGTVEGQGGRTVTEFFSVSEKALPRLIRLALCVGLLKPGEPDKDVAFDDATGKDLVIGVEGNEYTNRSGKEVKTVRIGYLDMWSSKNPQVNHVPKGKLPEGDAAPKPAAEASGGDWDKL